MQFKNTVWGEQLEVILNSIFTNAITEHNLGVATHILLISIFTNAILEHNLREATL